jgi:hypothetical protein
VTGVGRSPSAGWRRLPDRVLVLPADGPVLTLSGTAVAVWDALDRPRMTDDVVDELVETYGAARTTVRTDVHGLVDTLVAAGALAQVP